jgi:hypothetical protein
VVGLPSVLEMNIGPPALLDAKHSLHVATALPQQKENRQMKIVIPAFAFGRINLSNREPVGDV